MQEDDTLIFQAHEEHYCMRLIVKGLIFGRYGARSYNHELMLSFKSLYLSVSLRVWTNGPGDRCISIAREGRNYFIS